MLHAGHVAHARWSVLCACACAFIAKQTTYNIQISCQLQPTKLPTSNADYVVDYASCKPQQTTNNKQQQQQQQTNS
jgi:hypothetical protein